MTEVREPKNREPKNREPKKNDTATVSIAEANATLTAPGQIFEMEELSIRGVPTRTWKNAPPSLRAVLDLSVQHGDATFLVARAKVGGQEIEIVDHLRLGTDGRIEDMTVFFRPLPAAAAALRAIGAGLGRRRSRALGALISGLTLPLAAMTRIGDAIGARLVRASL